MIVTIWVAIALLSMGTIRLFAKSVAKDNKTKILEVATLHYTT